MLRNPANPNGGEVQIESQDPEKYYWLLISKMKID